jgi:xanthine dehydrogenase YagS FAD-binding subunit
MATIGGNLLQRTRCAYFTDPSQPCNKRAPGSGCPAIAGAHHNHAFDWTDHCAATSPSDLAWP